MLPVFWVGLTGHHPWAEVFGAVQQTPKSWNMDGGSCMLLFLPSFFLSFGIGGRSGPNFVASTASSSLKP